MPSGIAVNIGPLKTDNIPLGATLFRLHPSLGQFEHERNHVVVAFGVGVDHGQLETSVFFSNDKGDVSVAARNEALSPAQRIVGRHDIGAALANLAGGYLQVTAADANSLLILGEVHARDYGSETLGISDKETLLDYGRNNAGLFAAKLALEAGLGPLQPASLNQIDWKEMAVRYPPMSLRDALYL